MLRLNNLKTKTVMNAKISAFVICVEAIIYLSLYNLHGCTFKSICLMFFEYVSFEGAISKMPVFFDTRFITF